MMKDYVYKEEQNRGNGGELNSYFPFSENKFLQTLAHIGAST